LKIIEVIGCILTHLGLSAQPPPRMKARRVDLFQAAWWLERGRGADRWAWHELAPACGL